MTRDDFMEALLLLAAAVRACDECDAPLTIDSYTGNLHGNKGWRANDHGYFHTLADALTALLRDLGADVPEWPSAEKTRATREEFIEGNGGDPEALSILAHWIVDDPLDLLALLLPEAAR